MNKQLKQKIYKAQIQIIILSQDLQKNIMHCKLNSKQISRIDSPRKIPLILPKLNNSQPQFFDQLIVSPFFVAIKNQKQDKKLKKNALDQTYSRSEHYLRPNKFSNNSLVQRYMEEDRVLQKHIEANARYKNLQNNITERAKKKRRLIGRHSLCEVYDRLIALL